MQISLSHHVITRKVVKIMAAENNERYLRGKEVLARVEQNPHGSILDSLASFSPDLERFVVEFGYADVFDREGLSDQSRQLITISALAALGNAAPQLEFHINGALNVGCSPEQIIETFIHVTIYAGFPAALNAVSVARKVFTERGIDVNLDTHSTEPAKRFEVGSSYLERVDGAGGEAVVESLQDIAPDLGRYIVEYSFGDVYSRPGLSLWERELVSVSACSALGTCVPQLHVHINGFLNVGGTQDELVELMIQIAVYAGFPAALNAIASLRQVLAENNA